MNPNQNNLIPEPENAFSNSENFSTNFLGLRLFSRQLWLKIVKDECFLRASALAYSFVLSLVPMLAIFFSILTIIPSQAGLPRKFEGFLLHHFIPESGEAVRKYIAGFADNAKAVSIVGFIALIIVGVMLLDAIEISFNRIYRTRSSRSWYEKLSVFTNALIWGPVLLSLSVFLSGEMSRVGAIFYLGEESLIHSLIRFMLPFIFTWTAFSLLYFFIPNTRVSAKAAVLGGLVAGSLWELAKSGFDIYVEKVISVSRVYGSLGIFPIFLIWVYYSWWILLIGLEICYVFQNWSWLRFIGSYETLQTKYKPYFALRLVLEVSEAFIKGEPPPSEKKLYRSLFLDQATIREILKDLCEARILLYIESEKGYLPARDLNQLTVDVIIEAIAGETLKVPPKPKDSLHTYLNDFFTKVKFDRENSLKNLSLRDILNYLSDLEVENS